MDPAGERADWQRRGWDWPLGPDTRIGFGAAVLTAVALLAVAAFPSGYRAAARIAAAGCLLALAVDAGMLGYIVTTGQLASWSVPVAATLSVVRVGFTLARLPRVLLVA